MNPHRDDTIRQDDELILIGMDNRLEGLGE